MIRSVLLALLAAHALAIPEAPSAESDLAAPLYVASTNVADAVGRAALESASDVGGSAAIRDYLRRDRNAGIASAAARAAEIAAATGGYATIRAKILPEGVFMPFGETNELVFLRAETLSAMAALHRDGFAPALPLPVFVDHATNDPCIGCVTALEHEPGRGLCATMRIPAHLAATNSAAAHQLRFSAGVREWTGVSVDGIVLRQPLFVREISITRSPALETDSIGSAEPLED